jgi:F-type H+-transporting ATPase subunit delta
MAELITLARPYAKASFGYASATNAVVSWSNALALLVAATKEKVVVELLASPTLTARQKAAALIALGGDNINAKVECFLIILAENKRLLLLPQIQCLFEAFKAQQEKFLDVEVRTAFALDDDTQKMLVEKLSANFDSQVSVTVNIDKTLIGGIVICVGDTVVDGSVRGRLTKLTEAMN